MSILFAATYPARVRSLVLYGTLPRFTPELPDFPWGFGPDRVAAYQQDIETHWGDGALADAFFGSIADVPTSRTVRDLSAGSGLHFDSLGTQHLKGLSEETEVFRVSKRVGVPC
jgi:pimeloyl-ACP methyl ester carboxylesterase